MDPPLGSAAPAAFLRGGLATEQESFLLFFNCALMLTSPPVLRTLFVQGFRPGLRMVTSCQQHARSISEGVAPTKAPSTWMSAPVGAELICACMSVAVLGDHSDASSTRSAVEPAAN